MRANLNQFTAEIIKHRAKVDCVRTNEDASSDASQQIRLELRSARGGARLRFAVARRPGAGDVIVLLTLGVHEAVAVVHAIVRLTLSHIFNATCEKFHRLKRTNSLLLFVYMVPVMTTVMRTDVTLFCVRFTRGTMYVCSNSKISSSSVRSSGISKSSNGN